MGVAAPRTDRTDIPFDATCGRRLVTGNAVTLVGVVLVVVLARQLGAGWTIWLALMVPVAWYGVSLSLWSFLRPHRRWPDHPEVQRVLDDAVGPIADFFEVARPTVWVTEPFSRFEAAAPVLWPFVVVVAQPSAADDIVLGDDDTRARTLGTLAHEVGHLRRPWSHIASGAAARFTLGLGACTALRLSLGSWSVLMLATFLLVVVPGFWTMRWCERAADETARQLGYGPVLAASYDRSWARRWWTRPLWTHPSPRESARRLRAGSASVP